MEKKGIKSLIVTGIFVVVLALASVAYPKLVEWF